MRPSSPGARPINVKREPKQQEPRRSQGAREAELGSPGGLLSAAGAAPGTCHPWNGPPPERAAPGTCRPRNASPLERVAPRTGRPRNASARVDPVPRDTVLWHVSPFPWHLERAHAVLIAVLLDRERGVPLQRRTVWGLSRREFCTQGPRENAQAACHLEENHLEALCHSERR